MILIHLKMTKVMFPLSTVYGKIQSHTAWVHCCISWTDVLLWSFKKWLLGPLSPRNKVRLSGLCRHLFLRAAEAGKSKVRCWQICPWWALPSCLADGTLLPSLHMVFLLCMPAPGVCVSKFIRPYKFILINLYLFILINL